MFNELVVCWNLVIDWDGDFDDEEFFDECDFFDLFVIVYDCLFEYGYIVWIYESVSVGSVGWIILSCDVELLCEVVIVLGINLWLVSEVG